LFVEAVVFLSAIIGVLLALSVFIFHMITRRPEESGDSAEKAERAMDAVVDEALDEINKTAKLVLDELNEKYNALLFVYQLMDDKHKELEDGGDAKKAAKFPGLDVSIDDGFDFVPVAAGLGKPHKAGESLAGDLKEPELKQEAAPEEAPFEKWGPFNHPKYPAIAALLDEGVPVPEIARRLSMGQGEIRLIIGLSGR
jgi:hypothetical protein